jgi:hypothetical protein
MTVSVAERERQLDQILTALKLMGGQGRISDIRRATGLNTGDLSAKQAIEHGYIDRPAQRLLSALAARLYASNQGAKH